MQIRHATPSDAEALRAIYAPYVEQTAITFEYDVPTVEEFAARISGTLEEFPYLVVEDGGRVLGYAYAGRLKARRAFDWAVETSIYLAGDARGRGIGRALHDALADELARMGVTNLYALVAATEDEAPAEATEAPQQTAAPDQTEAPQQTLAPEPTAEPTATPTPSPTPSPTPEPAKLSKTKLTLGVKETYTLTFKDGVKAKSVGAKFSSSNKKVVTVDKATGKLKAKAVELGVEGPYTSFRHMFGWNVFGLPLLGPGVSTKRFFDTLNRVERELNRRH